jgi:hypothetical protein
MSSRGDRAAWKTRQHPGILLKRKSFPRLQLVNLGVNGLINACPSRGFGVANVGALSA